MTTAQPPETAEAAPRATNARETAFCAAYVADPKRNATAAAIKAGYAPRSARITGSRLLTRANIRARISELEAYAAEQARMTIADVLAHFIAILRADPNDLCSYEVGACRYCHGPGHAYQWRSAAEFQEAVNAWNDLPEARRPPFPPRDDGGYGFRRKRTPHPECPRCEGDGEGRLVVHDTRIDHPLFAGVKETQHGIEVKLLDRMQALVGIARILGAFEKGNRQKAGDNGLGAYLDALINSNRAQGAVLNRGEKLEQEQKE